MGYPGHAALISSNGVIAADVFQAAVVVGRCRRPILGRRR